LEISGLLETSRKLVIDTLIENKLLKDRRQNQRPRTPAPEEIPHEVMSAFRNLRCFAPLTLSFLLFLGGCHKQRVAATPPIGSAPPIPCFSPEEKVGVASWYGDPYHGRRTSNGETYNKYSMTSSSIVLFLSIHL